MNDLNDLLAGAAKVRSAASPGASTKKKAAASSTTSDSVKKQGEKRPSDPTEAPKAPANREAGERSRKGRGRPVGRPVGRPQAPVGQRWQDENKRASFYLSHSLIERVDDASHRAGMTKSDLVRQALEGWLSDHDG